MNKGMEKMISRDLGMDINTIRESSWSDLLKRPRRTQKAFRPKNMFLVKWKYKFSSKSDYGNARRKHEESYRKGIYEIKCLLKHMRKK